MGKRTGIITYNLLDTARTHTGQPRRLDIQAAIRLFNGPAIQEAVKNRDIVGYVGHGFREKYGLDPKETVIEGGKQITLEPSNFTVSIRCLPDGTVEHEQEFLDTAAGRIAERLWDSKAYGFSSAIHAPERAGLRVPLGFFGMDFVKSPNYTKNRGYMLDSAGPGAFAEDNDFASDMSALYDSVDKMIRDSDEQAREISEAYIEQGHRYDALLDECVRLKEQLKKAGLSPAMLDSAGPMQRPMVVAKGQEMLDSAARFMKAELPPLEEPQQPKQEESENPANDGFVRKTLSAVSSVLGGIV